MPDQSTQTDPALDTQYNEVVDSHRDYLTRLQEAFDKKCEAIGAESKKKLEATPESDKEARKTILLDQQKKLDETLTQLKQVVNQSSAEVRHKLEEIENKRDQSALDLEAELANL